METDFPPDPPMNWRWLSALTVISWCPIQITLIPPAKLGRKRTLLDMELSYKRAADAYDTDGRGRWEPSNSSRKKANTSLRRPTNTAILPEPLWTREKYPPVNAPSAAETDHRRPTAWEQLAGPGGRLALPGAKAFESLVPLPEVIAASTDNSVPAGRWKNQYYEMLSALPVNFQFLRSLTKIFKRFWPPDGRGNPHQKREGK